MSTPRAPFRPDDQRSQPLYDSWAQNAAAHDLPYPLDATPAAWAQLQRGAHELHLAGALDQGVELRHVRRFVQPLTESVLVDERPAAPLANVEPRETAAAHAAHTALAAMCLARALGLPRWAIADVGVAALLHDAGHGWGHTVHIANHELEGARRVMRATTWNALSLSVIQAVLEHHRGRGAPLVAQVVSAADAYVTLLAGHGGDEPWLSPAGSLARVVGPLRDHWHPAILPALVRALGLYPPGQVVQLDDGSLARALAPQEHDPARPWIARLVDARGLPVPLWAGAATPLPVRRHVVRALPRHEWPEVTKERPAA